MRRRANLPQAFGPNCLDTASHSMVSAFVRRPVRVPVSPKTGCKPGELYESPDTCHVVLRHPISPKIEMGPAHLVVAALFSRQTPHFSISYFLATLTRVPALIRPRRRMEPYKRLSKTEEVEDSAKATARKINLAIRQAHHLI